MNYSETLQAVDTIKALSMLGIEGGQQGAYVRYRCHKCGQNAVIKAYGDKKNVWYCPDCKASGHVISLVMEIKEMDWEGAKKLLESAIAFPGGKITKEIPLIYELAYDKYLESQGITQEIAVTFGIGKPKGKTMLSGCIAFAVHDENGMKVAYYGIRMKDGKPIFHHSFNPELYLYGYNRIDTDQEIYFTTDMFDCLRSWSQEKQAVCNFGLPYLSNAHLALLQKCKYISFSYQIQNLDEIAKQAYGNLQSYIRVMKK